MNVDPVTLTVVALIVIAGAFKWLVYTGLLWGMIKIQKLNYNVLGLFGSSLAWVLIGEIPYFGVYLSYLVLVICLWKCTGAEIAPDVLFTVGIASALMFCVNLWVIGALMGDLRPGFKAEARGGDDTSEMAEMDTEEDPDEEDTGAEDAATKPVPAATTAAPQPKTSDAKLNNGALSLKGISFNAGRPLVMISDGNRVHTITTGETFAAVTAQGRVKWLCEQVTKTSVTLKSDQGDQVQLRQP